MIGRRREDRRQVENVRAESFEVIEMLADTVEITAEELLRSVRADMDHGVVPVGRDRPGGQLPVGSRSGEAVRKDLVHHRVQRPVRPR